jgi:hypothetical protein
MKPGETQEPAPPGPSILPSVEKITKAGHLCPVPWLQVLSTRLFSTSVNQKAGKK